MVTLSIGNFDGVHAGHRALIALARQVAGHSGKVVAVTFEPLPAARLRPEAAPARLSTAEARRRLLVEAGADEVLELEPTPDLLGQSPEGFVAMLRSRLPFGAIVEGEDFRFGKGRAGDVAMLRAIGERDGFRTLVMPGIEIELGDLTMGRAASSLVRWMLRQGRVDDAARLLGRPYAIAGVTASGDRRGRTLGFPTANLADGSWGGTLLPADGVYAGVATLPDGRERIAAISIGTKSTFGGTRRTCEAHLPGESLPLDWYGWPIGLAFTRWVRGQMRFAGPEAIAAQIARDLAAVTGQGAGESAAEGAGVPA
jgi:riboflavin kinase/FMN adenylyltransferase